MTTLSRATLASLALLAVTLPAAALDRSFGGETKLTDDQAISVERVLAAPEKYQGEYLRITGQVDQVCERRGCWLSMRGKDSTESLHVRFTCPISGRLIPLEAKGLTAVVEGTLEVSEIPEDHARHMAEESGKTATEVAAIIGPQRQVRLASPAVEIHGLPDDSAGAPEATP